MSLTPVNSLESFNPDASAALMKIRIKNHSRLTQDIVSELHKAREFYSASGSRSDLVPDGTRLTTFEAYLFDIGLARRTAYNWLERYIPEENKLLTYEEFTQKKREEEMARLSREERDRLLVSEYRKTGNRPEGWTPKLEERVKRDDEAFAKQKERMAKAFKEKEPADKKYKLHNDDGLSDALKMAADNLLAQSSNRRMWKEKIRLSDGGKEDAFMDAIIDYLETLPDDNRRIEACNNIIKICRNISVELQKKKR
jgi:hypothetical protein